MKLVAVNPEDVPNLRDSHRGRVSYPLLKSFLESGLVCCMVDRTGIQQSLAGLTSCLGSYIRGHQLPVKMFTRGGQIYLLRLDLNEDGTPNEDYKTQDNPLKPSPRASEDLQEQYEAIEVVDAKSIGEHFKEERGKATK